MAPPLHMKHRLLARFKDYESDEAELVPFPFLDLGPLHSHVYPHFVVVNAAQKLQREDSFFERAESITRVLQKNTGLNKLSALQAVIDVQRLWTTWTSFTAEYKEQGMAWDDSAYHQGSDKGKEGNPDVGEKRHTRSSAQRERGGEQHEEQDGPDGSGGIEGAPPGDDNRALIRGNPRDLQDDAPNNSARGHRDDGQARLPRRSSCPTPDLVHGHAPSVVSSHNDLGACETCYGSDLSSNARMAIDGGEDHLGHPGPEVPT